MSNFLSNGVTRLKAAFFASGGAALVGYILGAVGAVRGLMQDRMRQTVLLWDFLSDAQRADVLAGTGALDCTAALQAAIDHGATLRKVVNGYARGGAVVKLPPGAIRYTEVVRKNGVSLRGAGRYMTLLLMSQNGGTGFRSVAATTQTGADTTFWLGDRDFSMIHNPAVVFNTPTILWNMVGFSRCTFHDIALSAGANVTGFSMKGATLAGSGGPAQWCNTFHDVWVELDGTGGIGWDLGDTEVDKEQITTWTWIGGRTASSNNIGTGMKINSGTGIFIFGHVLEGCTNELLVGSPAGTRGCQHVYIEAYFEGSGGGYTIYPNAIATQIKGFRTGVPGINNGTRTMRLSDGEVLIPVSNAADSFVLEQEGPLHKPKIKGSSLPGLRIENNGGSYVDIKNNAAGSSGSSYLQISDDSERDLLKIGVASAQMHPSQFSIGNQSEVWLLIGAGTPEGAVAASPGSTYQRTNGGVGTSFYVKETGTGNTGWAPK